MDDHTKNSDIQGTSQITTAKTETSSTLAELTSGTDTYHVQSSRLWHSLLSIILR